jgi:hypothetical protein
MWTKWPSDFTLSTRPDFPNDFPNLKPESCVNGLSPATVAYNCYAWGARVTDVRWEPDPLDQYYWPESAPRAYTMPAFVVAYQSRGFEICVDGSPEPEIEKIAIYDIEGVPQHVARQLNNGSWTSKMGDYEDIQHVELSSVSGPCYGIPRVFMARKLR